MKTLKTKNTKSYYCYEINIIQMQIHFNFDKQELAVVWKLVPD